MNFTAWLPRNTLMGLACFGLAAAAHADLVVSSFILPGATGTSIWDISDSGQLVGAANDGTTSWGYVYDAGTITRLNGPTGATGASAIGISNNDVVVGNWSVSGTGAFNSHPYVYAHGSYLLSDLSIAGASTVYARGVSPDGRYLTGYFDKAGGGGGGYVYDLGISAMVALIDIGATNLISQGINSAGQVVGNYTLNTGSGVVRSAFLYDIHTGVRTDFNFSGVSQLAPRGINDQGQIAGWLTPSGGGLQQAWIGNDSGYQVISASATVNTIGEGLNNLGQVVGFLTDPATGAQSPGFIASPAVLPTGTGSDPHVYTFSTTVVADVPIFIDPLVAVGYTYAVGAGNPLFKTVSLPAGVGDNLYEIVVGDQHFTVSGNQIFDFTTHGYTGGVAAFTVLGIEPEAQLEPTSSSAFVTRLTFAGSGAFTGTQTALTVDYTAPVPEAGSVWLMFAGLAGLLAHRRIVRAR
jgi:hypothetical protein